MQLLPVLSVRESVILPGSALPLRVGRKQSIEAVEAAQKNGNMILAVSQKSGYDHDNVEINDLRTIGTLAQIDRIRGNAKEGYQIFLRGVSRYRVNQFSVKDGYIAAAAEEWKDVLDADPSTFATMLDVMKNMSEKILQLLPNDTRLLSELVKEINDLSHLTYLTAANLDIDSQKKQEILETAGLKDRSLKVLESMQKMKDELEVQVEIRNKLGHKLGKHQRETILREQLRTIQEELGDIEKGEEKDDLRKKILDAGMPEDTLKVALDEFKRLESMGPNSPESHVIRNYLDLLVALPWKKSGSESEIADLNLDKAREILDAEHYGLDKIKKRVLQHLAVMKLKKTSRGQILLLVGPPGVGKTSLGQSIAKALGRKFVRGSLGGVRDDAEIRGHRRTYIGAMPGRIIQGIKRAGENNPVFMLDEIDKLGRGFQGDPAAALLEVLDPEQNATFLDHYLDVPFDLSNVFFIATANSLDTIPGPLLDRMEIIDLSGYTTAEKLHIAKNHLIPKQWTEHGLSNDQLMLSDEALLKLISSYTREAGVRDLQRKIVTLCRAMAEKVLSKDSVLPIKIELADIEEVFGNERFTHEVANTMNPPGVATGLAWTPQGGEILFIEANLMPGKGSLILTGQLGEVMRESTQIALSLVRSRLAHVIPGFEFERKDIHVHVPAGAIPKDGPSAGITMLTTIASLLTGRSISPKLAMTGELTLRGAVMPVGGIKEKLIAAHRAGIEKVILSKRNQKDLKDVPEEVRHGLKIELVETAAEVLKIALDLDASEDFVPQGFKNDVNQAPTAI
ncbi:endopeptidase La [Peredibacter sp. HCB2-198]|uniref:endopeptidase La n=1 Tax=Peredibacter sp. HCB2-198 TaxID=3383025 RepID=UPI0038B61DF6